MSRSLFVTGTDTGVGKTRVSCALLRAFAQRGLRTAGMKPIAAGAIDTPQGPRSEDALALMDASTAAVAYEIVNPYLFAAPIAPHLAAAATGVTINRGRILALHQELAQCHDIVVVEGAGGLLVPLGPTEDLADLALGLEAPVLLVVGLRLGCLNHALLTAEAILRRGLELAGWVGSQVDRDFQPLQANLDTLRSRLPGPCWGVISNRQDRYALADVDDLFPSVIDSWWHADQAGKRPPATD